MINEEWVEQPNNHRKILIWEYFEEELILSEFYKSLKSGNIEAFLRGKRKSLSFIREALKFLFLRMKLT